jgi:hypothetical protein
LTGRAWPTADFRQPEKSISLYQSSRVLIFQRIHRQHPANCGPTVTINQRLQYVRKLTADFIIN